MYQKKLFPKKKKNSKKDHKYKKLSYNDFSLIRKINKQFEKKKIKNKKII